MTAFSVLTIVLLVLLVTGGAGVFLLVHRQMRCVLPQRGRNHRAIWALMGAACALICAAVWGVGCAGVLAFALCAVLAVVAALDHATRTIPNTLVTAVALIGALALILSEASAAVPVLSTAVPLSVPLDWGTALGTLNNGFSDNIAGTTQGESSDASLATAPVLAGALPHALFPALSITAGDRILGIFAASVPLLLVAAITGGFGGGDVKLLAALGLCLGWRLVLLTFIGAVLLGGVYAAWLLATKRAGRTDAFAFGPFICIAAGVVAVAGNRLAPVAFATVGLG